MNRQAFQGYVRDYLNWGVNEEPETWGLTSEQVDELDDKTAIHLWADDPRLTLDEIWAVVDEAESTDDVNEMLDSMLLPMRSDGTEYYRAALAG